MNYYNEGGGSSVENYKNVFGEVENYAISKKIFLIAMTLLFAIFCVGIHTISFSNKLTIKENWGISIPQEWNMVYHSESEDSWFGDGIRYTIYEANTISTLGISLCNTYDKEMETVVTELVEQLDIPEEYLPDWEISYQWEKIRDGITPLDEKYFDKEMYIIWFPETEKAILVELFL